MLQEVVSSKLACLYVCFVVRSKLPYTLPNGGSQLDRTVIETCPSLQRKGEYVQFNNINSYLV